MGFKLWLENLLLEEPHRRFLRCPAELSFLDGGVVELNFEKLNLDYQSKNNLTSAFFNGHGVLTPDGKWRLKDVNGRGDIEAVEAPDSADQFLPPNWKQFVYTLSDNDVYTWIGRMVRLDQIGNFDPIKNDYINSGEGWVPPS